jgi:ubiquinone/menaquinone biosynthesis C-methylase UbiE
MAGTVERFQISLQAAEVYESRFVPAIFREWAPHLVQAAGVVPGQAVLDVGCGTGVVARAAADRMGGRGRVVGLDLNEGMLTVARRLRADIEWRRGDAAELPFEAGCFDVVLCQAALMFFPDRAKALREMARVAADGGTVALQVWDRLEAQPGYQPLDEILLRHAGQEAMDLERSYWALEDLDLVSALLEAAGLRVTATRTRVGTVRFASADDLVRTEVQGTPLGERISADGYRRLLEDARAALRPFATEDGKLELPIQGHLIAARKGS